MLYVIDHKGVIRYAGHSVEGVDVLLKGLVEQASKSIVE